MTAPKDKIVYEYDQALITLTASNITSSNTDQALTWHEFLIALDQPNEFGVTLDPNNTRAPTTQYVTLNRPGLYNINVSLGKLGAGSQVCDLSLSLVRPTGAPIGEYLISSVCLLTVDFQTMTTSSTFRVLPQDAGTKLGVTIRSVAGGNTAIRGWNATTGSYEQNAESTSQLTVIYMGP